MALLRIVCYVDYSAPSAAGARIATRIARRHGAELTLAHAVEAPVLTTAAGGEYVFAPPRVSHVLTRDLAEKARAKLSALAAELRTQEPDLIPAGIDIALLHGEPVDSLMEYARASMIDLIVVGTDEPGFFARHLHSGTAERMARRAPCPVLAFTGDPGVGARMEHLLVAVDLTHHARVMINVAADIVGPGGRLELLHVGDPDRIGDLRRFVAGIPLPHLDIGLHAADGEPASLILEYGAARSVDAVVVGSHPHEGIGERIFGSVADRVLESGERPVIAVPDITQEVRARVDETERSRVDRASWESFPASDPPAWWGGSL